MSKVNWNFDVGTILLVGAGLYALWSFQKGKEADIDRTIAAMDKRTNSWYAPMADATAVQEISGGTSTTYFITKDELANASPFERDLLKWGVNVGTVETVSAWRSAIAEVVNPLNW
jgi:hypothetical protein